MKGPKQVVNFRQGRQLLKWLDRKHSFEIRKLASQASRALGRDKPKGAADILDFIVRFRHNVEVTGSAGQQPSG